MPPKRNPPRKAESDEQNDQNGEGEKNAEEPKPKKIKDMTQEEKRKYNKRKTAELRARKKSANLLNQNSVQEADSAIRKTKIKDMTEEEMKTYNKRKSAKARDKKKSINILDEASVQRGSDKKIKDMSTEERNQYKRRKSAEYRAKKSSISETTLDEEQSDERTTQLTIDEDLNRYIQYDQSKRRKLLSQLDSSFSDNQTEEIEDKTINMGNQTETDVLKDENEIPSLHKNKGCKIRFGLIDLFQVETEIIVVPHYKPQQSTENVKGFKSKRNSKENAKIEEMEGVELSQMRAELHRLDADQYDNFEELFQTDESKKKLDNYGCMTFNWQTEKTSTVRQLKKESLHVLAPSLRKESNFSVVTEAHLRAAYLTCLLEADLKQRNTSLAFPILGHNVCPMRSVAIGIQTIFAYMHAVKKSNLNLIYIVTPQEKVYDKVGKLFSFVREFDLRFWNTEQYLKFEQNVFDRLKPDRYYATIPGTDIIWRCLKISHERGMIRDNNNKMRYMHEKMTELTGIINTSFIIYREKDGRQHHAEHFIINKVKEDESIMPFNLLSIRFDLENFCGSNQVLRKLWILSYFQMYFELHYGDTIETDYNSEQCKKRKDNFHVMKLLHVKIVTMWNDTLDHAPFRCQCKLQPNGYHEQIMVFLTKLSHPDFVMDDWVLDCRSIMINNEPEQSIIKDIKKFEPDFVHRLPEDRGNSVLVTNERQKKAEIESRVHQWLLARPEVFAQHHENLLRIIENQMLNASVGEETSPNSYNPVEFDDFMETDMDEDERTQQLKAEIDARREEIVNRENDDDDENEEELSEAIGRLKRCMKYVDENRYIRHFLKDLEQERTLRNRYFHNQSVSMLLSTYSPIFDQIDIDDCLTALEELWEKDGKICTIDEFISGALSMLNLDRFTASLDIDPYDPYESSSVGFIETDQNDAKIFEGYPEPIDIGDPTEPCPYCGAMSFESERTWSCCKNGSVWIPPFKRVPKEIDTIFNKQFRPHLISTNSSFSMASIQYTRVSQAKGGVQSFKNKGIISCHPSAIYPRNENQPAYANFITLNMNNEGIAMERLSRLKQRGSAQLKKVFVNIQNYLDANNRLYEVYKNMRAIDEELRNEESTDKGKITFRIVPPGELDDDELKTLQAHNGVYARPSRMDNSYISVAFTWNVEDTVQLPRGLRIYPKNPKNTPQEPLSIYSDLCDLMSYPLFFPDAIGGWALHKYKRVDKKTQKNIPLYIERVKAHLEEVKESGERPEEYYDLDEDEEIRKAVREIFCSRKTKRNDNLLSMDEVNSNMDLSDDDDSVEDDPDRFSDEEILERGILEDFQDDPVDENEVGKLSNVEMIERGGDRYPMYMRNREAAEIPFKFDFNPFPENDDYMSDDSINNDDLGQTMRTTPDKLQVNPSSDRSTPHEEIDRFRDGTDDFANTVKLSDFFSKQSGFDSDKENVRDYHQDDEYQHFEGAAFERDYIGTAPGEQIDMAEEHEILDENKVDEDEDEDVCFGDEHNAEKTALGRKNDGIRVKNIGHRQHVSLAEYAKFQIQKRRGIPCRFQGRARTLGQLHTIDLACRIREMRMAALTEKRAEFPSVTDRRSLIKHYSRMLEKKFNGKKKLGMLVTMPSTVPGTSKYQKELVMSAVTISNKLGNPHLFITFTGNPEWPEIKRECAAQKCDWSDIPEFVNRVFKRKYELFLEDVIGKSKKSSKHGGKYIREEGMFGAIKWYNYSVEFQQRGMPHCHLLVSLQIPITNAEQVDQIISAEVPKLPIREEFSSDEMFESKMRYYNAVKKFMVHHPCKGDPTAYCNKEKKRHWNQCCKGFPKKLTDNTILSDNQYPDYKKKSGNVFILHKNGQSFVAGDEYIVAHNPYLLTKYNCHMNIEIVSSIKTMKYMFKYIHKGADRVLLECTERVAHGSLAPDAMTLDRNVFVPQNLNPAKVKQRQDEADRMMNRAGVTLGRNERVALNDCSYMMDMSAMTACEAAWRISGYPMHGCSHIVHRGYVHEENKDLSYTLRGVTSAEVGEMLKRTPKGMMAAWFEANQNPKTFKDGSKTTDLTMPEMLSYYMFDSKKQQFIPRKKDFSQRILGRIQAPQPRWLELTATRLLAQTVKGPKSWEELRTHRGTVYETCLQAARARGLMDGDTEWHLALTEIAKTENPVECRRFFASLLVHCAPSNPKELWEEHWENLVNNRSTWTVEQKKAHALRHIGFLLGRHGMCLGDFELDKEYDDSDLPPINQDDDVDNPDAIRIDKNEHKKEGDQMYAQLNAGQKKFVSRVLNLDLTPDKQRMLFVDGPGGTGKTFCYKTIYHVLTGRGRNVVCVSHTGIAACLLPNGCTAHRKFSIPLEVSDMMACKVALEGVEGRKLSKVDCIIWDEACMTDRRIIDAVNTLFKLLKNSTLEFGGVMMIFGGDWRQILPIVENVKGPGVIHYTLKNSVLFNEFEKFKLTENQRAISDPDYAERILKIGDGSVWANDKMSMVRIPEANVERRSDLDLAEWVFPDVNDTDSTKSAAILTIDNKTSLRLNDMILDKLDGELHEFLATDTADKNNALNVDPEHFTSETPSGMPPHKLRLKIGAQVVLLRNISVEQGLCNGTRLTIQSFGDDIIRCSVNNKMENSPESVFLHRMMLSPTGKGAKSCGFTRLQYPLRLAYACTINKSQGQTLSRCGLVLHSPVFSHGQLYVAMSRVQRGSDFKLWHTRRIHARGYDRPSEGGILVKNVVYNDILRDRSIDEVIQGTAPLQTVRSFFQQINRTS